MNFFTTALHKASATASLLLMNLAAMIAPTQPLPADITNGSTTRETVVKEEKSTNPAPSPLPSKGTSSSKKVEVKEQSLVTPKKEPTQISTPSQVSASTDPAIACLLEKKSWNTFASQISVIDKKYIDLLASYNRLAYGTENKPTGLVAWSTYNYERMTSGKAKFTSDIESVRKLVDAIQEPSSANTGDITDIKSKYNESLNSLQDSSELALSTFKVIADHKDGVGMTELNTSKSLLDDSSASYKKANASFILATKATSALTSGLNSAVKSKGCVFTFNQDKTIFTSTLDESYFTGLQPTAIYATKAKDTVSVAIETKLPIKITTGGKQKTALTLECGYKEQGFTTYQVSKDNATTYVTFPANYGAGRKVCSFHYNTDNIDIFTRSVDFEI